jgi:uncharacterized SAM-binding protein YcdF (DUF218 family)
MVDLSVCQGSTASQWADFSWHIYDLLSQRRLVIPTLASLIVVPWLLRSWRWRMQARLTGILLVLLYMLAMSPLGGKVGATGLALLIPDDKGQSADAIVVLGRGERFRSSRVQTVTDLWKERRASLVFASGRGDAIEIGQMLEANGLPSASIEGEPCSTTTNENALFTAAFLKPRGTKRLVLVTDFPHMARSLLTFRSLGFEVIPYVSPMPADYSQRGQRLLVVREWIGLISYGLMGRYFARTVEVQSLDVTSTVHPPTTSAPPPTKS